MNKIDVAGMLSCNKITKFDIMKAKLASKGFWYNPKTGEYIDVSDEFGGGTDDHVGFLYMKDKGKSLGVSRKDAKHFDRKFIKNEWTDKMGDIVSSIFRRGNIRVRNWGNTTAIETDKVDETYFERLKRMKRKGILKPKDKIIWEDRNENERIDVDKDDFEEAETVGRLKWLTRALKR